MDDPEVVVGIPTYNNEDTIGATIEMLLDQERRPDRVVFCDKSTDETRQVIRERTDGTGLSVEIIDQDGDGVADAYDRILEYVTGEYDLFVTLQSELTVASDWLAGHIEIHRNRPEIDLVNGDNKRRSPTDREVQPDERPYYVGRNFSAKPGVLEQIDGWDPNFLRGEDWDMRIRLAGAGVRAYARTAIGYHREGHDPYITLAKAKRRPTSLTFLAKFGTWYLWFHPSHVVSDLLSVGAVTAGIVAVLGLGAGLLPGLVGVAAFLVVLIVYTASHVALRGGVDGSYVVGPVRKQLLNGIAVLYAAKRLATRRHHWNMTGFDPDAVPRYRF